LAGGHTRATPARPGRGRIRRPVSEEAPPTPPPPPQPPPHGPRNGLTRFAASTALAAGTAALLLAGATGASAVDADAVVVGPLPDSDPPQYYHYGTDPRPDLPDTRAEPHDLGTREPVDHRPEQRLGRHDTVERGWMQARPLICPQRPPR
jgi:hypothetical protein